MGKRTDAASEAKRRQRLTKPDDARKMTLNEFSRVSAIPVRTLREYIEQGMPTMVKPERGKTTFIDSGEAIAWLMKLHSGSKTDEIAKEIKSRKAVLELARMELQNSHQEIRLRKDADQTLDKVAAKEAFEEVLAGFAGAIRSLHRYAQDIHNLPTAKATQQWLRRWSDDTLSLLARWRPQ